MCSILSRLIVCGLLLALLSLGLSAQALPDTSGPMDELDSSILSLQQVEQQLTELQLSEANLQAKISILQNSAQTSSEELQKQAQLLADNRAQQAILSKNYAGLLALCKKLEASLRFSQTLNKIAIPVAGAAIIAVILLAVIPRH